MGGIGYARGWTQTAVSLEPKIVVTSWLLVERLGGKKERRGTAKFNTAKFKE